MDGEPLVWDRVEWRQGDGRYRFEVARGGLHATLTTPAEHSITMPLVAWDALLDALMGARKTKARSERSLPVRAGSRWEAAEVAELEAAFRSGASIGRLARSHNRTQGAIEAKLAEVGLWDRMTQSATARAVGSPPAAPREPPVGPPPAYDPRRGWLAGEGQPSEPS
ncbi:MAG: hypothetical protein AB7O57_00985 [Hyphomicrobiaceae bacterium]